LSYCRPVTRPRHEGATKQGELATKRSSVMANAGRVEPASPRRVGPTGFNSVAPQHRSWQGRAVIGELGAGALAGLAVAMPIGPVGGYLIGLAARAGFRVAAAAALGVATVDGGYAILAAVGGSKLVDLVRGWAGPLRLVAALVLGVVAVRTVRGALRRYHSADSTAISGRSQLTPGRAYLTLIAMTALNPATVLTFAAIVLGRNPSEGLGWAEITLFVVGAFTASAVWQLGLASGGTVLGGLLRGRRGQLAIALVSASIMVGLAVAVLVSG